MNEPSTFAFCPYDGQKLVSRMEHGIARPTCSTCGYIDYANPKACVAVVIEQDGKILLGLRADEPAKGLWDILGGFIDAGETAEDAVHREMMEETGLQVEIMRYLGSFPDTYGPRRLPTLTFAFVAVPGGGTMQAASDVGELRWFAPDMLPEVWAFPHQVQVIEAWRGNASAKRR
jgi:NADH pyrophosphatase NudC (nudix superfamily)